MSRYWIISLVFSSLISSCGFYHEKDPEDPSTISAATVSWPLVSEKVFERRCSICHSLGADNVNISTYDDVLSSISRIQDAALVRKNMPPDSPLTPYEETLLSTWISAGTPYQPQ